MMSAPTKGWGWPAASKKAHYFNNSITALCGSWMYTGPLEDNEHQSLDNCKSCMKKREVLEAKSKPKKKGK